MTVRNKLLALGAVLLLAACANDGLPLPTRPDLASSLAQLDLFLPKQTPRDPPPAIDTAQPLTIDQIGLIAILNDPDLKSERGQLGVARAKLLQATLLPNPAANFALAALLGGPGSSSAISGGLSEDLVAIILRHARVQSARAGMYQVNADLLWGEWQVAQKARQLALDIYAGEHAIALTGRELRLIEAEIAQVTAAISAGNLTLTALSPLLAAKAAAEQSLAALGLGQLKNWQTLDARLGLVPSVRFAIAQPVFGPLPPNLDLLAATLPERRPDLAALRFGYSSAEADVRAAILGQFPALTLGGAGGRDTTAVLSGGPTFTVALPIFDRNQGVIAQSRATRLLLREQYQARLDAAVADIHALSAELTTLSADRAAARQAAAAANALATTARQAYAQGNLDQRTLTDYETTALERALQVVEFERQIGEDRVFLAVELGLGLPPTRLAPADRTAL
ncbi:MAG TPA: TolC family protein [Stellaceae bacterium]|jgi:outer membrane protein TolC